MAEDEAAENNLIVAIKRVDSLPWPRFRHDVLAHALYMIADLLHFQIVKIQPPVTSAGGDSSSPPTKENPHGNE